MSDINAVGFGSTVDMLGNAISGADMEHAAIADNIANVNTPNYHRQSVSFKDALAAADGDPLQDGQLGLQTSDDRQFGTPGAAGTPFSPVAQVDDTNQMRADGSNVDVDQEMAQLSQNSGYSQTMSQSAPSAVYAPARSHHGANALMADMYNSIEISASGLSAERLAMDVIANNIANANTTSTPQGGAFKRQLVVFAAKPGDSSPADTSTDEGGSPGAGGGVQTLGIVQDTSPDRLVFEPGNPEADARGYVHYPNVQIVKEMVDLMAASRAYQANVTAIQESRNMSNAALGLLRS